MRIPASTQKLLAQAASTSTGGANDAWDLYKRAKQLRAAGEPLIDLTIGCPDTPAPQQAVDAAVSALQQQDDPSLWRVSAHKQLCTCTPRHCHVTLTRTRVSF